MTQAIVPFLPDLSQVLGLIALFVVIAAMLVLGAVACGTRRLVEADLLTGWAVLSLAVVLIGVPAPIPLYVIFYTIIALAILGGVYLHFAESRVIDSDVLRLAAIGAPILLVVGAMLPGQWDELSNWLPNARYLFENDVFPRTDYPAPLSMSPADPHGLALVMYGASLIARRFAENSGALFNVALLLAFAHVLARMIRMAVALPKPNTRVKLGLWAPMTGAHGWAYCAVGALAVTVFNPAFSPGISFSATADSATAVVFGFGVVIAWMLLDAVGRGDEVRSKALAWQLGLSMLVLVNLRDTNPALFVILLGGIGLIAWRDPGVDARTLGRMLPYIVIPPLLMIGAWKLHINVHLSDGTFDLRPVEEWGLDIATDDLSGIGLMAAVSRSGFFLVIGVAVAFAGYGLMRVRGSFDRLAILAGISCLAYQLFLLAAYATAFGDDEVRRATSYWRLSTHLGGAAVAFATYGGALLWREYATTRLRRHLAWVPLSLALAFPLPYFDMLREDRGAPAIFARAVGADLAMLLPTESRLAVLDAADRSNRVAMLRYEMNRRQAIVAKLPNRQADDSGSILDIIEERRVSHIWMHTPSAALSDALDVTLPPGASYLLSRQGGDWRIVRRWRHAGLKSGQWTLEMPDPPAPQALPEPETPADQPLPDFGF